jgi:cytochrome P450
VGTGFNPFLPDFQARLHHYLGQLRASEPWHRSYLGLWVITRYADAVAVLKDARFSAEFKHMEAYQLVMLRGRLAEECPATEFADRALMFRDPPDHTRLRKATEKYFNPRTFKQADGFIRGFVRDRLAAVQGAGKLDLIRDLALPLPVAVIAHLLELPEGDLTPLARWTRDITRFFDPGATLEAFETGHAATRAFNAYLKDVLDHPGSTPRVIDRLAADLSTEDVLATCVFLFIAGHETTVNLIGNGTLSLLQNPGELDALVKTPELLPKAIEEILRYEPPVQVLYRMALEDVEMGGVRVEKGQQVMVHLGAANRDPDEFDEPDRLTISRHPNRHLAFSHGRHFCLGATLARLEGEIALGALLETLPRMRLTSQKPAWRNQIGLRGLDTLPLELA